MNSMRSVAAALELPNGWVQACIQAGTPQNFRMVFCGYLGEQNPTGWQHTIQLGDPNCRSHV
jgi:hypothetical protein